MLNSLSLSICLALGGLGLFLVSIKLLSNGLRSISGEKLKYILKKFTKTNLHSFVFGLFFTTMIQSSDGSVALIISLVSARFLPLKSALAFVLGANIGTATTSIIVSLQSNFAFTQYFMIFIFIGGMAYLILKDKSKLNISLIIASLGMLFLGLKVLGLGVETISKQDVFTGAASFVGKNVWLSSLTSFLMTGLMQSSSASITIAQSLYQNSDVLNLNGGIGFVLGANIGTTITAFLVSVSGNRDTKRIALFWMITNLCIAFLVLPFVNFYSDFIRFIVPDKPNQYHGNNNFQISMAHLLFNCILVVVFFPLLKYMEKLVNWIIKENEDHSKYSFNLPLSLISNSPELSLQSSNDSFYKLGQINLELIKNLNLYILNSDKKILNKIEKMIFIISEKRKELFLFLIKLNSEELDIVKTNRIISLLISVKSQFRISVLISEFKNIVLTLYNNKKRKLIITKEFQKEINKNLILIEKLQKKSIDQSLKWSKTRNYDIKKMNSQIYSYTETLIEKHILDMEKNKNILEVDYYALIHIFERISKHQYNVSKYFKPKKIK